MIRFDRGNVGFGRHQTFSLRYGWLSKAFRAVERDPTILRSDIAIADLGVGKNMVESMGYWLRACRLLEPSTEVVPTELGQLIFAHDGVDPYLEDEATIWLLHWLICSNPTQATSWYWFFNKFHKVEFSAEEIQTALIDYVKDQVKEERQASASTLKNDAILLPRMYSRSSISKSKPIEDALDSPFALLGLISQSGRERFFSSVPSYRDALPTEIVGFAVLELLDALSVESFLVEDLLYSRGDLPAPGSIFRLTEQALIGKLEQLVDVFPGYFRLDDTAGLHQLFRTQPISGLEMLRAYYQPYIGEVA